MRITPTWNLLHDSPVPIAEGLAGPSRATLTVEDYEGYDLTAAVVFNQGRYECEELCVRQRPGGPPVSGEAVRAIPIAGIVRQGISDVLLRVREKEADGDPLGWDAPSDLAAGGPTDNALRWVARVYRIAQALGQAPTQTVQRDLGLPRSTAGRWISLARKRGLLDPPPVKHYPPTVKGD